MYITQKRKSRSLNKTSKSGFVGNSYKPCMRKSPSPSWLRRYRVRPWGTCNITRFICCAPRPTVIGLRCSGFASLYAQLHHILPARESSACASASLYWAGKTSDAATVRRNSFRAVSRWCFRAFLERERVV
jgi:hypothetical protein